jgi:DNA-binding NarL/FixJ family response regulator
MARTATPPSGPSRSQLAERPVIRVLIVDDHSVVRSGVRLLLESEADMEPVGEAADAKGALEMAGRLTPDVVLMDVGLPGTTGVDAAAEIRHILPDVRILMLSMQDDPSYVRQAFANGAIGYVLGGGRRRAGVGRPARCVG